MDIEEDERYKFAAEENVKADEVAAFNIVREP